MHRLHLALRTASMLGLVICLGCQDGDAAKHGGGSSDGGSSDGGSSDGGLSDGGLSDSGEVLDSSPGADGDLPDAGVRPGCPATMPTGMLFCDDFEDGDLVGWLYADHFTNTLEEGHLGGRSLKYVEESLFKPQLGFGPTPEVYVTYWWQMGADWPGRCGVDLPGPKFMRLGDSVPNGDIGFNAWWTSNSCSRQFNTCGGAYRDTAGCWNGSEYDCNPYFTGASTIPLHGAWIKIAVHARSNTSGNNDGLLRFWIRDTDFDPTTDPPDYECTTFRWSSTGTAEFGQVRVVGNSPGGGAAYVTYVDDVRIWNRLPTTR